MEYKKINAYLGWFVFLISAIVYFLTIEDTVSLWDCGEYITAAYKLEVGHPPGAPFFMILGRLFSFFAEPEMVAVWINRLSALTSALTILFMFWSLTLLVKKMILRDRPSLSTADQFAIFGSAMIGSLAYTFSDSFWFSAVEGEVYAMSSLFTAVIFWAILKWDEEMMEIQSGIQAEGSLSPDRWILLIMFLLGLAIGVHLLGILVVPAIAFVIYFRKYEAVNWKGIVLVGVLSVFVLGFIQEGVIPGSIAMASAFEVSFVNSFGLPFYSGTVFFFLLVIVACGLLLRYARKKNNSILYTSTMSLILLLIGYGSFAVIVIRSNANTPLDENDPENLVTLKSYLKREQYGSAPLLFGPHWNSKENPRELWDDQGPTYLRRFVVVKNDIELKAFKDEKRAQDFAKNQTGVQVVEKYFESNAGNNREKRIPTFAQSAFFPRMYWNQEPKRIEGYKAWSKYDPNDGSGGELGSDGKRLPTFGENFRYFTRYQVNWMYWRYFMWNFAGRQNDIQGHGDAMRGNWISGLSFLDTNRLGDQDEFAPYYTKDNPANNRFYLLPFVLGLIGLFFHFYRSPKDAFVVFLAFLFTGVAIVVYLNQKPFEPRERDYAFAGSFYFFALWIGIGVYALYESFRSFSKKDLKFYAVVAGAGLILTLADSVNSATVWVSMMLIAGFLLTAMAFLKKALKSDLSGAVVSSAVCLVVPLIMAFQGWDDHDRSEKTTAHDLALNYLNSCEKNGIIFTNGDNDTFPLWYMQEVEGKRTDVRVCNLSLLQTDWYTDQMKMRAYDSDPLPIKFTEDQILMHAGSTDHVLFSDLFDLFYVRAEPKIIQDIIQMRLNVARPQMQAALESFATNAGTLIAGMTATDQRVSGRLKEIEATVSAPLSDKVVSDIYQRYQGILEVFSAARSGLIQTSNETLKALQESILSFEDAWNVTNLSEAMTFVRDDKNITNFQGQNNLRVFPSSTFILPVNKENALKSGIISKDQLGDCLDEIRIKFDKSGISREQVMMLDILANNEWKRPIYFSSPGGSDVSMALLRGATGTGGYIKQNGMAFELSPLNNSEGSVNRDHMFNNLTKVYKYGKMYDPKVLTDYYARRHTIQYRSHFIRLAEDYLISGLRIEEEHKRYKTIKSMDPNAPITEPKSDPSDVKKYKSKAKELIHFSLKVMPAEHVIDYGEPMENNDPRKDYQLNGRTLKAYSDGILHDYVRILFMADDKDGANKLGMTVASQLESIIRYFEKSPVHVAASPKNTPDLYAAVESYFQIHIAANDAESGDPSGILAKRTSKFIEELYSKIYPGMLTRLKDLASSAGESTRRSTRPGYYASMLFELQDYTEAMALSYGLIDEPVSSQPQMQGVPGMPLPEMMNPKPD